MHPVHFGKTKFRRLVPSEFESKLLGARLFTRTGWSDAAKVGGILFDLSRIEWVDLGALVQLVLLAERALLDGITVTLALPLPEFSASERKWLEGHPAFALHLSYRVRRRRQAKAFLEYLRLKQAILNPPHLLQRRNQIHLVEDWGSVSAPADFVDIELESEKLEASPSPESDYDYKFFFPLTWLYGQESDFKRIGNFLAAVIGEGGRGVEGPDADAIANVILYELAQNVAEHSQSAGPALVAAWARRSDLPLILSEYLPAEHAYFDWFMQKLSPLVDIIIGDSGMGIPMTLGPEFERCKYGGQEPLPSYAPHDSQNIMLWAFDRWSSSSKKRDSWRGTRGLYRVDRVVKEYQGLVTVRAENHLVGWDHGGPSFDKAFFEMGKLGRVPGTVLRLRLPAYSEVHTPRMDLQVPSDDVSFEIILLGELGSAGFSSEAKERLQKSLQGDKSGQLRCTVAVVEGGCGSRDALENALRRAVEIRHPGALVIYGLPGGWQLVNNAIDSINAEHEKGQHHIEWSRDEHFDVWDPVLVLDPSGRTGWAGASEAERNVLQSLVEGAGILDQRRLNQLLPRADQKGAVLRRLRNDVSLAVLRDDGSLMLRVSPPAVCDALRRTLVEHVLHSREGVLSKGIYRAPSLHLVGKWLNVARILDACCSNGLALWALAFHVKQHHASDLGEITNFILADSTATPAHVQMLKQFMGIKRSEIIPGEVGSPVSPGIRVIPSGSRVLIYADMIASGEAVERYIRHTLREGALPVAVACLFDGRSTTSASIEVWGIEVPVFSLARVDVSAPPSGGLVITNINPVTREPERAREEGTVFNPDPASSEKFQQNLNTLIRKYDALYFTHIGRPIGRHFTFYLDATQLITDETTVKALHSVVDDWVANSHEAGVTGPERNIVIWYPAPEDRPSAPARSLAYQLKESREDIEAPRAVRREPAYGRWFFTGSGERSVNKRKVLIVDWGALTGGTIMQMLRLAAEAGADKVLVCVFLSQLSLEEENFLRSLNAVRVASAGERPRQGALPGFEAAPESERTLRSVPVSIQFLCRFPVAAYAQRNDCPVCQQLARLSQEEDEYPTPMLAAFAKRQREDRLFLRTREDVANSTPLDFYRRPLDTEQTIGMAYFRELLTEALGSTLVREEVSERLRRYQMPPSVDSRLLSPSLTSVLHFLSIEPQWLHRPPLHFRELRERIAQLALTAAKDRTLNEIDRLNAVVVLRTASKKVFAGHFSEVFISSADSPRVLEQLLYDAFTYIVRPYHQAVSVFIPLYKALVQVKKGIEEGSLLLSSADSKALLDTVDSLLVRVEFELAKAGTRLDNPAQAWAKLREIFSKERYHPHDEVPVASVCMLPGQRYSDLIEGSIRDMDSKPGERPIIHPSVARYLKSLGAYWDSCRRFLDNNIVPGLMHIKPMLLSKEGRNTLGTEEVDQLVALLESRRQPPIGGSEFSKLVYSVSEDPTKVVSRKRWDQYRSQVKWFRDILLKPEDKDSTPAKLIEFLHTAPTVLGDAVRDAVREWQEEGEVENEVHGLDVITEPEFLVFCTERLLHDIVKELLKNIWVHRDPEQNRIEVWLDARAVDGRVTMWITNSGTVSRRRNGVGVKRLNDRLEAFGGKIQPERPRSREGTTYSVSVMFLEGV